jgi:hypothetical protein
MMNLWGQFSGLFARDRTIRTVVVQSVNADGTSTVTAPGMAPFKVVGTSVAVAGLSLIQQGRIIGQGSALPTYEVTV